MKALQGCAPSEVKMQQPGVVDPFLLSKGEKKKAKLPPPDFFFNFYFLAVVIGLPTAPDLLPLRPVASSFAFIEIRKRFAFEAA